jgi:hypothetical protein
MSDYHEHFGFYAAQIFSQLLESFPIPIAISSDDILGKRIEIERFWELQREETNVRDMIEVLENTGHIDDVTRNNSREKLEVLNREIKSKRDEITEHRKILEGTQKFLEAESYILNDGYDRYQLTEKGLNHISKKFSGSKLT